MKDGLYISANPFSFNDLYQQMKPFSIRLHMGEGLGGGDIDFILIDLHSCGALDLKELERCKRQYPDAPLLVFTACTEEEELLTAFQRGTDGYIKKPCSPRELASRIKAVLRRKSVGKTDPGKIVILDRMKRTVTCCDTLIKLTEREYQLFSLLVKEKQYVVTREYIAKHVWSDLAKMNSTAMDVHIHSLRKKFSFCTDIMIRTVTGKGFSIVTPFVFQVK